jgi:hypothetical protein
MGHGLPTRSETEALDEAVNEILLAEFDKGVANSGERKGMFEMEEAVQRQVPWTVCPSVYKIGAWVSSHIQKQKKTAAASDGEGTEGTGRARGTKTAFQRRQEDAGVLRVGERPLVAVNSPSNEEVLRAKYAGVALVHRGELHAVTDVVFCATKGAWCVRIAAAERVADFRRGEVPVRARGGGGGSAATLPIGPRALQAAIKAGTEALFPKAGGPQQQAAAAASVPEPSPAEPAPLVATRRSRRNT